MPGIEFRHLFDISMSLHPPISLGSTPAGDRRIFPISGGSFQGERLKGEVFPQIGHDLLLGRTDGGFQQDVRLLLMTHDGANILMTYRGIRRASAEVSARLAAGEAVDASEYYLRTTPLFETGDDRYAWLNGIVAVATGARQANGVMYEVYEVL
jgi:hypothetical protein